MLKIKLILRNKLNITLSTYPFLAFYAKLSLRNQLVKSLITEYRPGTHKNEHKLEYCRHCSIRRKILSFCLPENILFPVAIGVSPANRVFQEIRRDAFFFQRWTDWQISFSQLVPAQRVWICFSFWRSTSVVLFSKCRNLTKTSFSRTKRNGRKRMVLFKAHVTSQREGSNLMFSDIFTIRPIRPLNTLFTKGSSET